MTVEKRKIFEPTKIVFFILFFIICAIFIFGLPRLAIPIVIAYVLFLIISPLITPLMKTGLSRGAAVGIIFLGILGVSVYPVIKIVPAIKTEAINFQYYLPKMETFLKEKYVLIKQEVRVRTGVEIGDEFLTEALVYVTGISQKFLLGIPKLLASLVEWIFVIPLLLFFFLKDGKKFKFLILQLTPNLFFERFYYLSNKFNKKLGDYIFAKFIEASIVGVVITLGLLIVGVRFSLLLGIVAAITNIVPYLGPFLGMVPAIILGISEYGMGSEFGIIMILYIVANAIDLSIVFPLLVSKIVNLHPIIVVVSVILGSQFLGIMGMVVSIPLAVALKLILSEIYNEIYLKRGHH